jgi:hypothetical protein
MELMHFTEQEKSQCLTVARKSIEHYLRTGQYFEIDMASFKQPLSSPAATFVTLKKQGKLRGCIGHLEATQPLILDVSVNAIAAATRDCRFASLSLEELKWIQISISVLSQKQTLSVSSEPALLAFLAEHQCGLVLSYQNRQATFLPSVWQTLSTPKVFLNQLKLKAGLAEDFWSSSFRFETYQVYELSE